MKILSLIIVSLLFLSLQANEQVSNTVSDLDALYKLSESNYPSDSSDSLDAQIQSLETEIENKEKLQSLVKEIKKESMQKVSKVGGALTSLAAIKFLPKLFKKRLRVPDHKAVDADAALKGLNSQQGKPPNKVQQMVEEAKDPNSRTAQMGKNAADAQAARERVAKVNQDRGVGNPADNNPAKQQTAQDPKTSNQGQQQQQEQNANNNKTRKKAGSSSAQTGAARPAPVKAAASAQASQASPGNAPEAVDSSKQTGNAPEAVDSNKQTGNAPEAVDSNKQAGNAPEAVDSNKQAGNAPEAVDSNKPEAVDSNNQADTEEVKKSKVKKVTALAAALGRKAKEGSKAVVNISGLVVDKVGRPIGKAGRKVYEKGKGALTFSKAKLKLKNPNPEANPEANKPGVFKRAKDRLKSWTTWSKKPKVEKPKADGFFSKTGRFFKTKTLPAALIGTSVFLAYSAYGDYEEQKAIIDFAEKQYGDYLLFESSKDHVTPAYLTDNTDNYFEGLYGRGMVKDIFLLDLELLSEKPGFLGEFEQALEFALKSDKERLQQLRYLKARSSGL